jgi:hypothetical protein
MSLKVLSSLSVAQVCERPPQGSKSSPVLVFTNDKKATEPEEFDGRSSVFRTCFLQEVYIIWLLFGSSWRVNAHMTLLIGGE